MSVRPQSKTTSYIYDVAISDVDDTIYLLVTQLMSPRISSPEKFEVQVFNETLDFQLKFLLGKGSGFNRLTFSGSKVFILKERKVFDLCHARNGRGAFMHNLSRGWAMMISLFFSFHFFEAPLIISGVFSDPPSREVDLSKENIIAPLPHSPST